MNWSVQFIFKVLLNAIAAVTSPFRSFVVTPCPSALMRCAPVASPVDKLPEIATPVLNYVCPVNKRIGFLPWS